MTNSIYYQCDPEQYPTGKPIDSSDKLAEPNERGEWVCGPCKIEQLNKRKLRVLRLQHPEVQQVIQQEDKKVNGPFSGWFMYLSSASEISASSQPKSTNNNYKQKQIPFDGVVGYNDLKVLLMRCLTSKENCNILLSGPPASSKTIFLLSIQKEVSNACFIDAANASGPGLVDYLFEHPDTQVICIDELDKLKKSDQTALLNLLESGILASTKVRKTRSIIMKGVKVFATSNGVDRLIRPLRSRFLEFELPEYTWEAFLEITQKLLRKRYGLEEITSAKVAEVVWSSLQTRDLRDALAIGKLVKSTEDVEFIAITLQKYKRRD
ncbi:MAG TPA: AAA family ATPase [Nitrososphaeraceae archaeon]|nr:AAA family ATPase [Nitrososphaeraceae archaeon]